MRTETGNDSLIADTCLFLDLPHIILPWEVASQVVLVVKNPSVNAGDIRDVGLSPGRWQPTPVFLSGESHGQSCLAGYSPRGGKKLDTTKVTEYACI